MKVPGGYQLLDLGGVTISTSQDTTITNKKIADILRNTRKPVYIFGAKVDDAEVFAECVSVYDTGAYDGKAYRVVSVTGALIITTTEDTVTFTPVNV